MFDLCSAYGTVGLSLGYVNEAFSFCGTWRPLSLFLLTIVMLMGRHRNLPDSIDPSVRVVSNPGVARFLARPGDGDDEEAKYVSGAAVSLLVNY